MKILWHSNSPFAPTGYGNQTGLFTDRLDKAGYEVIVSCFYGLQGAPLNLGNIRMLPGSKDAYGNDVLLAHSEFYETDMTLILCDAWVYNPEMLRAIGSAYFWAPVDHDPVPPAVLNSVEAARGIIAYSKFGEAQFKAAGLTPYYVPHGVDSKVFKIKDQAAARAYMHAPNKDIFMAGMVLANKGAPSRKAFDQQIRAFAAFHKRHPDSMLYLHTDMKGLNGEDIGNIIRLSGLPRQAVAAVQQYEYLTGMLGNEHMMNLYNSLDVVMNATRGEGFGIPVIEAQMCGTPVIVTNATAMPELVKAGLGWKVPYVDKIFTAQNSYQFIPSVKAIEDSLEAAYQRKKTGKVDREAIRQWAMQWDADTVFEKYMLPVMSQIDRELDKDKERNGIITIEQPKPEFTPDVSVVMPVFNGVKTIDKAIKSVLDEQPSTKLELIVIDDCSTDGTWKHLRGWRKRANFFTYKMKVGGGPVGALNESIQYIRGRYVIKLDADDWFEPDALRVLVELLDNNPDIGFAYGACQYHGEMELLNRPSEFNADAFLDSNRAIGEPMYRATAHSEHKLKHRGFWNKDERWFGPHDWDLMLQMIHTLKWSGITTQKLIHHYNHVKGTASTESKARNGAVMEAFKKKWPQVRAGVL